LEEVKVKKIIGPILAVILVLIMLLSNTSFVGAWGAPLISNSLDMQWYRYDGSYSTCSYSACGPSAGVSIGRYYRTHGYPSLPDDDDMYEVLYDEIPTFYCYSEPLYYGYGFVEMTQDPDQNNNTYDGYYNFGYVYDDDVSTDDFWAIVDAIDNGWPVALSGNFGDSYISKDGPGTWPPTKGHYIAISGYSYYQWWPGFTWSHRIICTDSLSRSHELILDWNTAVGEGSNFRINIIKDEIPEDFEWGTSGQSLQTSGGNVDWTVSSAGGYSSAKITTLEHSGTRAGMIYRDGTNNIEAYYDEDQPIWRGFWLRKYSGAVFYTSTGDGSHCIHVRVLDSGSDNELQYYYNGVWRNTGYSLPSNTWRFIEFRAIRWASPYRYDIYVDGNYVKGGAYLAVDDDYEGITAYYSNSGLGSFYIDDISSSWW
jgi:hypothetical protein